MARRKKTGSVVIKLHFDDSGAVRSIEGLDGRVTKVRRNAGRFGASGAAAFAKVAGAIGGITGALMGLERALERTIRFERAMANVGTMIMGTGQSIDELTQQIASLSGTLGSSTQQAEALYMGLSAGIEASKAVEFVGESAKFAQASLADAATSVDLLTTVLNAYGLEAERVTEVSDILFEIIKQGKTTGQELAGSLGRVIPTAATLNISLRELGAALATLTKGGIRTDEAVTSINQALMAFLSPSSQAAETAKRLGVDISAASLQSVGFAEKLSELAQAAEGNTEATAVLFGNVQALKAVLALTGSQAGEFTRIQQSMLDVAGNTNEAFLIQTSTVGHQMETLWNNLAKKFEVAAGELGPIVKALKWLNETLEEGTVEANLNKLALDRFFEVHKDGTVVLEDGRRVYRSWAAMVKEGTRLLEEDLKAEIKSADHSKHLARRKAELNKRIAELAGNMRELTIQGALSGEVILATAEAHQRAAEAARRHAEQVKRLGEIIPVSPYDYLAMQRLDRPFLAPRGPMTRLSGPPTPFADHAALSERRLRAAMAALDNEEYFYEPPKRPTMPVPGLSGKEAGKRALEILGPDFGTMGGPPEVTPWMEFEVQMSGILGNLTDKFGLYQQAINATGDAMFAFATGQAVSMRQLGNLILAELARQATVKAVWEMAQGFADLFLNPPKAAAHFQAAALYGAVAGMAGGAGRATAGGGGAAPGSFSNPVYTQPAPTAPPTYTMQAPGAMAVAGGGDGGNMSNLIATSNQLMARNFNVMERLEKKLSTMSPGQVVTTAFAESDPVSLMGSRNLDEIARHGNDDNQY